MLAILAILVCKQKDQGGQANKTLPDATVFCEANLILLPKASS
jgi:hypothetical protein